MCFFPCRSCNVKDLFRPVLPDVEVGPSFHSETLLKRISPLKFAERSVISTWQDVPVPYLQKVCLTFFVLSKLGLLFIILGKCSVQYSVAQGV